MPVARGRWRSTERGASLALMSPEEPRGDVDSAGLGATRALFLRLAGVVLGKMGERATEEAGELLARSPDWADLRALARREGVSAALWPRLRGVMEATGAPRPPAEVEEAFRREAMVGEFRARRLEARLHEVLDILSSRGIEPVLLKGAGLAYAVHGGMARRPMGDIDLLVPAEAVPAAVAALRSAGWESERGGRPGADYSTHQHAPPLVEPGGGPAVVELHDALLPQGHPFGLGGQRMLARARRLTSPLGAVLVPRLVDQLLHVAVHLAWSHELRWGAWRAFADVAGIVAVAAAEDAAPVARGVTPSGRALDEVVGEARCVGAASCAYWTLRLAEELGGAAVPEPWLAALEPPGAVAVLGRHLAHQLLPGPGVVPSVRAARLGWTAAIRPGWSGHGGSRPWLVGVAVSGGDDRGTAEGAGRRPVPSGRAVRWWRYTRAMTR